MGKIDLGRGSSLLGAVKVDNELVGNRCFSIRSLLWSRLRLQDLSLIRMGVWLWLYSEAC